jgi:propionyl-CoA carboxylase alpha chain
VNGAPLSIALDYTPGDRLIEADFGEGEDEDADDILAVRIAPIRSGWKLTTRGAVHDVRVLPSHVARHAIHMIERPAPNLSRFLMSPMPGRLVALHVRAGDHVQLGQPLAVVEAMKMENILRATRTGTIAKVMTQAGATLAVDEIILELD